MEEKFWPRKETRKVDGRFEEEEEDKDWRGQLNMKMFQNIKRERDWELEWEIKWERDCV